MKFVYGHTSKNVCYDVTMIFNVNTQKAMKLCYKLHENQYDQNGNPYVFHLMYVAQDMKDEQSCIAALLHGTLADGKNLLLIFLREEGISEEVCNLLLILKKKPQGILQRVSFQN